MATYYQKLDPQFSGIKAGNNSTHLKITLFKAGRNIGTLCTDADDIELLRLFFTGQEVAERSLKSEDAGLYLSEYGRIYPL